MKIALMVLPIAYFVLIDGLVILAYKLEYGILHLINVLLGMLVIALALRQELSFSFAVFLLLLWSEGVLLRQATRSKLSNRA
jgi:hypothetical protein